MPDKKDHNHDQHEVERQEIGTVNNEVDRDNKPHPKEIGRVHNEQPPVPEKDVPEEQREIGRINNEQDPRHRREEQPEEQEIGVVNNEKRD